MDIREIGW